MMDARKMGTYLYADPEGRQQVAWLRHGTAVQVEIGKYTPGQRYVRVLNTNSSGLPRGGWISPTWLALDPAAGTSLRNVLGFKDQVSTYVQGGDQPDPEHAAAYSQSKAERERPAPPPAPTLTLYSLYMHVSDFADYQAHPKWKRPQWWSQSQYRVGEKAKDRQAAAPGNAKLRRSIGLNIREQPNGKSAILGLIPRDSCIETGERSPNGKWARIAKVTKGAIDAPMAGGNVPTGALDGWVYLGELAIDTAPEAFDRVVTLESAHPVHQGDVIGYLGEDVPSQANPIAGQPVSRRLLHLELFSSDDVPTYLTASRQWAAAALTDKERTLLVLRPGDTLHTEPNGAVACTLNWAQILPLSALELKEVDGQRWRKVTGLTLGNGRMGDGWAKETGHLASPWEWPGFDIVDERASDHGGMFGDLAAWAGFIKKEAPRPEETPFYKKLRALLDTDRDGKVSEEELDAALRDRTKAGHLGRLVVRHDSAWAAGASELRRRAVRSIAELLGADAVARVQMEEPRSGKLPWWDEVADGLKGFPKSPRAYHFHPGGLAGAFAKSRNAVWPLGKTSERYESGGRGPGVVSTGKGDHGGVSYGVYQMSSRQGVVQKFIAASKYRNDFAGLSVGNEDFNEKWRRIAEHSPEEFREAQHDFIKRTHYEVQANLLRGRGLPLNHRRAAIHDMIWSTSVQFGPSSKLIGNAISTIDVGQASDRSIIEAVQNYKIENNALLFASSPALHPGLLSRAKDEKSRLLKLEQDGYEIED